MRFHEPQTREFIAPRRYSRFNTSNKLITGSYNLWNCRCNFTRVSNIFPQRVIYDMIEVYFTSKYSFNRPLDRWSIAIRLRYAIWKSRENVMPELIASRFSNVWTVLFLLFIECQIVPDCRQLITKIHISTTEKTLSQKTKIISSWNILKLIIANTLFILACDTCDGKGKTVSHTRSLLLFNKVI